MKRAGLVDSIRGAQGGYKLNKPMNEIKIIDLIEALESPITIVDYSKNTEVLLSFWKKIEGNFKELFNNTLEDLVKEEDLIRKKIDYQI